MKTNKGSESPVEIGVDPVQPEPLDNTEDLFPQRSPPPNPLDNPLVRTLAYASGGILFVYLSQQLFNYIKPYLFEQPITNQKTSDLVKNTFPFSYVPESTPQNELKVDFNTFDALIQSIKNIDECKHAVFEDMLLNRAHRVLVEKKNVTNREIHACLWLTLHSLLLLQSFAKEVDDHDICQLVLRIFKLDDLFEYLELERTPSTSIAAMRQHSVKFKYPVQVVWLAYAILSHLYTHAILLQDSIRGESSTPFDIKYLFILEHFQDLNNQVRFGSLPRRVKTIEKKDKFSKNEISTKEKKSVTLLNSQSGLEMLQKFLRYSKLILTSEHSSLVKLGLVTFGQLFASCDDGTVRYLLTSTVLDITSIVERLVLCENEEILNMLGKCLFTACVRDIQFIQELITNNTIVNETIQIAIFSTSETLRVQYMNLIYVMILHNEKLATQIVRSTQINFYAQISEMLQHTSIHINFVALQLLYGIAQFESLHSSMIGHSANTKKSLIKLIKVMTFSPHAPLRYYSVLIWDVLINPRTSVSVYNNQNTRFLCKNEHVLDVLVQLLKEEQELSIKRTVIQLLRELASRDQNMYERNVLVNHFNVPFECIEILKYHIKYAKSERVTDQKYFHQVLALIASTILLLSTLCEKDEPSKDLVKNQYRVRVYVDQFLQVLDKQKQPFYENMAKTIRSVTEHVFQDEPVLNDKTT